MKRSLFLSLLLVCFFLVLLLPSIACGQLRKSILWNTTQTTGAAATDGQAIVWDSTLKRWVASTVSGGGGGTWGSITGTLTDQTEFTSTPTINKVPIASVTGGKLATGWIPDLSATYLPLHSKADTAGAADTATTAAKATVLATARAINGQDFDGSAPITVPINNANDTTNASYFPLFTATQGGNYAAKTLAAFTFNPSTSTLTATNFAGNASTASTATTATNATNITTAVENTETTCFPMFVTSSTPGNLPPKVDTTLTYNSNTHSLGCTTFVGALTGTASGNLTSGGALGTPASGTLSNCTGTPLLSPTHGTIASAATIYPSSDGTNTGTKVTYFTVTALAGNTVFALPPGSWNDGDKLIIRIKDNSTARALDFVTNSTVWRAGTTTALPTTTVLGKTLYTAWLYNSASSTFDLVGLSGGF